MVALIVRLHLQNFKTKQLVDVVIKLPLKDNAHVCVLVIDQQTEKNIKRGGIISAVR